MYVYSGSSNKSVDEWKPCLLLTGVLCFITQRMSLVSRKVTLEINTTTNKHLKLCGWVLKNYPQDDDSFKSPSLSPLLSRVSCPHQVKHCEPLSSLLPPPQTSPITPKSLLASPAKTHPTAATGPPFTPWWPQGLPSHCYWLSWPARGPHAPRPPCCSGHGRERGTRVVSTSLWSTRAPPYSRRRRWWEVRGSVSRAPDWEMVQEEEEGRE